MDSLALRIRYQRLELRDEPAPTGFVHLERGAARAVLLTPDEIEPDRLYPLVAVLHGAGRQDELLARACRDEPEKRKALFLIPRSVRPTWDLIAGGGRPGATQRATRSFTSSRLGMVGLGLPGRRQEDIRQLSPREHASRQQVSPTPAPVPKA